ncbi:MAG: 3-methyl-2-oxobutanoate hydroxymethyltransferase, partial [Alphaproteobacteria bacterium]
GAGCDGQSLFAEDLLGYNTGHIPRHAKVYRNHAAEYERLNKDAIAAFSELGKDVESNKFPTRKHTVDISTEEFETFMYAMEKALAKKA